MSLIVDIGCAKTALPVFGGATCILPFDCFSVLFFATRARTDGASQFRQTIENGYAAQPQLVVDRGIAADHLARIHVVGNAALRRGDHAVADLAVSGDADLPRQNN